MGKPRKILIVEDDMMITEMLEGVLITAGYDVCGIARTVAEAVALVQQHKPDLAIVDVRVANDDLGTDIVVHLGGIGRLGVLYATGNKLRLTAADGHACIGKPYSESGLLRALDIVSELTTEGTASPPFPRGFHLLA